MDDERRATIEWLRGPEGSLWSENRLLEARRNSPYDLMIYSSVLIRYRNEGPVHLPGVFSIKEQM